MANNFDVAIVRHCFRVAIIVQYFAKYLNLTELEIDALKLAGMYHDLGLIGQEFNGRDDITDSLLVDNNPRVPNHINISNELMDNTQPSSIVLSIAKLIVQDHHERYDGKGYPQKLRAGEIHRLAPILSICDYFDSILWEDSNPPPLKTITKIIGKEANRRFSQNVVIDFNIYLMSRNN